MKNILIKLKRLFCLCAVSRSLLSDDEIRHALENSIKKYNVNDTAKEIDKSTINLKVLIIN